MILRPRMIVIVASIMLALFSMSCNDDYGIFYHVQLERKQRGFNAFQNSPIVHIAKLGDRYYAANAKLYSRSITDDPSSSASSEDQNWQKVNLPASANYWVNGLVTTGSTLYAAVSNWSSTSVTPKLYSSTDGSTWSELSVAAPTDLLEGWQYCIDNLYIANNQVFAEVHAFDPNVSIENPSAGHAFYLYYLSGSGLTTSALTAMSPAPTSIISSTLTAHTHIRGVAYSAGAYWFASFTQVYSGASADGSGATDASSQFTGLDLSKGVWSVSEIGGTIYIGTANGSIYSNTGVAYNLQTIPISCMAKVPSVVGDVFLVGTDTAQSSSLYSNLANGYLEGLALDAMVGGASGTITNNSSVYSTTLSSRPVLAFYYDSARQILFAGIAPGNVGRIYGLYSTQYNGSSWSGWAAE